MPRSPSAKSRPASAKKQRVARFSISIPSDLAAQLDHMVGKRGYKNRSQAVAEMVRTNLAEHKAEIGTESMAGTITLVYDYRKRNLEATLSEIQHRYYLMVVASMHVHLENHHYLEVLLVQGPPKDLHHLADELITCKGVKHGKLQFTTVAIPPLL